MEWTRGRTIGQGSSASVSVATLLSSGDVLAVKSSSSETLQREQQILSSLSSPYIVNYRGFDVTAENGRHLYNLFMEFSPRGTLSDEIRRHGGSLGEDVIAKYTRQILLGLDYIHSKGLAHCDIKGRNVLVGDDATARIADFGCARWVADTAAPISGTPSFMAPEVARGDEQGSKADVWAVGCTVVEMATGKAPWGSGGDPVSLLYRIGFSGESPEIPCCLSDKAADFLGKCLRRESTERWTAAELLNHSFLSSSDEDSKFSNSPTSILDLSFWSETEPASPTESTGPDNSISAVERIKRLSCSAAAAVDWSWDEKWVAVREDVSGGAGGGLVGGNAGEVESGVGDHRKWDLLGGEIIIGHNSIVKRNYEIELISSLVS